MKDGAKVLDCGVSLREPECECFTEVAGASTADIVACEWFRACEVGVDMFDLGGEKMADFGRPTAPGPGDGEAFLAKGLFRTDPIP